MFSSGSAFSNTTFGDEEDPVAHIFYDYSKDDQGEINMIEWKFPNFPKLLNITTTAVRELSTTIDPHEPVSRFQLKMFLVGKHNDFIEIYFVTPASMYLKTDIKLRRTDSNGETDDLLSKIVDFRRVQGNRRQRLMLFSKSVINGCNTYYTIVLTITIPDDGVARMMVKEDMSSVPLLNALSNLLGDDKFSDVTLKSVNGEEHRAHKAMLAARSYVLKAHFEHNTLEAVTNIIETPFESDVLKELLVYIYTSKTQAIEDIPEKLLASADYYQLTELKKVCEETIRRRLTVENAIDTLLLAELHSADLLKQSTLEFIKWRLHLIIKTEAWAALDSHHFELLKGIIEYIHCPV